MSSSGKNRKKLMETARRYSTPVRQCESSEREARLERLVMRKTANKGKNVKRTPHNPRELAFAELWADECEPRRSVNHGQGLVQDLFVEPHDRWPFMARSVMRLTRRERMIAATCIQWLGSNCGMDFLRTALERCGYRLTRIDDA